MRPLIAHLVMQSKSNTNEFAVKSSIEAIYQPHARANAQFKDTAVSATLTEWDTLAVGKCEKVLHNLLGMT